MQLGGVLSTSHVAKSFIGTGRLNPDEEEEAKGAAVAAPAGDIPPPGAPPAPSGTTCATEAA